MCMGPPDFERHAVSWARVYPHVYGATDTKVIDDELIKGLSPCVWGHLPAYTLQDTRQGSIPMCMGPPGCPEGKGYHTRVYPHVYGATMNSLSPSQPVWGLSPCVWGHLL